VLSTALNNVRHEVKRWARASGARRHQSRDVRRQARRSDGARQWLDYTIELYAGLRRPMPIEFVDQMYAVLRRVDAVNLPALRAYLSILQRQARRTLRTSALRFSGSRASSVWSR
jgi:hypothetical protein